MAPPEGTALFVFGGSRGGCRPAQAQFLAERGELAVVAGDEWARNVMAISGNVGGLLGDPSRAYIGSDVGFQICDYFAFGPEISYFFGDTSGLIAGLEFRPYFVPYSRSILVKPHAYFGGGYFKETAEGWGYQFTFEAGYARAGGGIDFRIPGNNIIVPYFDVGAFVLIKDGETATKGQAEGGVRFAF